MSFTSLWLRQTPKDKLRWWEHKQRVLEHWLDTSGDEITVEGASALIRGQLRRGDEHEHLRIKCWKHIVIELSALVEDDAAPSNGTATVMTGRCCRWIFFLLFLLFLGGGRDACLYIQTIGATYGTSIVVVLSTRGDRIRVY